MDEILLARVPWDAPLPEAFAKLRRGTSAIVLAYPNGTDDLVTVDALLALANEATDAGLDIDAVPVRHAASLPTAPSQLRRRGYGRFIPDGDVGARQSEADREGSRPAFTIRPGDDTAVVTAPPRLAAQIGDSFTLCRCRGMPVHRFRPEQLTVPGVCNKPHAVPVDCGAYEGAL